MASLDRKIQTVEELFSQIEQLLDELLGEEREEILLEEQQEQEELFEIFAQTLSLLKEQEERTLKSPATRWKMIETPRKIDWNKITIADLFSLYRMYAENDQPTAQLIVDDSFEKILARRREEIQRLIENHPGKVITMETLFQGCVARQVIIATFLVLLELIFRQELRIVEKNDGKMYLEKGGTPNLEKSS